VSGACPRRVSSAAFHTKALELLNGKGRVTMTSRSESTECDLGRVARLSNKNRVPPVKFEFQINNY